MLTGRRFLGADAWVKIFPPTGPISEEPAMANPPSLTPEQRQLALQKAAAARRQRAEVKDKLKIGSLSLAELFEAADRKDEAGEMLAKLKVVSALESLPGVGKVRARNIMTELDISESRRLRGLGTNQRAALLLKFGD
jgi:hypothetical protein